MSLADVIYNALTGQSGAARPSFGDAIRDVVQERTSRGISRRQLARETGIPESTLRRWEKGQRPERKSGAAAGYAEQRYEQLIGAHRHLIAVPSMMDRWRANDMRFTLTNFPEHGRTTTRTVSGDKLDLSPGTGDRIVAAFLRGDDGAAARALVAGIRDPFYEQVFDEWVDDPDIHEVHDSDYSVGVS